MIHNSKGYEIRMQKCALRTQYKAGRRALPAEEKQKRDEKICSLFLSSITYRYADVILMYAPMPDEIDVLPIARAAGADGKVLAFPLCDPETCTMEYHIVQSPDELRSGSYGIAEPSPDAPVFVPDPAKRAVCIVPGLVYDQDGFRLGYGKGYYDRYLSSFSGVRVGMVYADFLLPRIPRGRFDLSVDLIVTEKGVRAVHAV